jgi:thioredoxin reductase (NADPH)
VRIRNRLTGDEQDISLESLFVMIGAHPRTSWVPPEVARDSFDFLVTGTDAAATSLWDLERRPHPHETTVPGVFAVGDVRGGSVKRVASAVGEGSVVVSEIHQYLATAPN